VIKKERYSDFKNPEDQVFVEDPLKVKTALPVFEIIKRALSRIGERGYDLLLNNCEHFARWCRYGEAKSYQAEIFGIGLGAVGLCLVLILVVLIMVEVLKWCSNPESNPIKPLNYYISQFPFLLNHV
jgi:hypothetical protein